VGVSRPDGSIAAEPCTAGRLSPTPVANDWLVVKPVQASATANTNAGPDLVRVPSNGLPLGLIELKNARR